MNSLLDFIRGVFGEQSQMTSPLSEFSTLNDPGRLYYAAQKQAINDPRNQSSTPTEINRQVKYPEWMANAAESPKKKSVKKKKQVLGSSFNPDMPIYDPNVSTESAKPIIQSILSQYAPTGTPDGYKSPLLGYVDDLASVTGSRKLDPRLLALLAISETGALKPGSRGYEANNPFSTIIPGSNPQTPIQYNSVSDAIKQYPDQYLFKRLPQDPTLSDFIGSHNPEDNPTGQLKLLLQLASQFGL